MKRTCRELEQWTTTTVGSITADAYDLAKVLEKHESFASDDRSGYILKWVYITKDGKIFTISGWNVTRNIDNYSYFQYSNWDIRGNSIIRRSGNVLNMVQFGFWIRARILISSK